MSVPRPAADPDSAAGSPAAPRVERLRQLYDATAPQLLGLCVRILGDGSEAEEVVVEAYVAAARHAPAGDGGVAWLCAVARDRAVARLRARSQAAPSPEHEPEEVIPAAPSAALKRLQSALAELTPLQAAAIRAAYLDGADYPTLAARAAAPLGTLKSALRRGLLRLSDGLDA